jgi:hypothetical protein
VGLIGDFHIDGVGLIGDFHIDGVGLIGVSHRWGGFNSYSIRV